jgi:hypothetical protein
MQLQSVPTRFRISFVVAGPVDALSQERIQFTRTFTNL